MNTSAEIASDVRTLVWDLDGTVDLIARAGKIAHLDTLDGWQRYTHIVPLLDDVRVV